MITATFTPPPMGAVLLAATVDLAVAVDNDGDTYDSSIDCNDGEPTIHPG